MNIKKEKYKETELEIIRFLSSDVITTSDTSELVYDDNETETIE